VRSSPRRILRPTALERPTTGALKTKMLRVEQAIPLQ
jgi:hypothetical protein